MNKAESETETTKYVVNLTTQHYVDYKKYMEQMSELVSTKKTGKKFWSYKDKIVIAPPHLNKYVEKEYGYVSLN